MDTDVIFSLQLLALGELWPFIHRNLLFSAHITRSTTASSRWMRRYRKTSLSYHVRISNLNPQVSKIWSEIRKVGSILYMLIKYSLLISIILDLFGELSVG